MWLVGGQKSCAHTGFGGKTRNKNHSEDLGVDGRIKLKWISIKSVRRAWTALVCFIIHAHSIIRWKFLTSSRTVNFSRMTLLYGVREFSHNLEWIGM
jgi:hypothetical protein